MAQNNILTNETYKNSIKRKSLNYAFKQTSQAN